jgi:hypothetical protein
METQQDTMSFPQLVMPEMQMPTRRPFTTKGKAMGKLRVMVAGETGAWSTRCAPITLHRAKLTARYRCRQVLSRSIHCPGLRRHRARRSAITLPIVCAATPPEI